MHLWQKILIGMVAGAVVGIFIGEYSEYLKPLGELFLRLIKMLVVPLVFFSLISGVTSLKDPKSMGRVGSKVIGTYIVTTMFAITIGLIFGWLVAPGEGVPLEYDQTIEQKEAPPLIDMVLNIVPTNPVEALTNGDVLQIIFFALFFGIALALLGKKAQPIIDGNEVCAQAMYKMTNMVMLYAPFGVFALMAWVTGTQGLEVLGSLMKLAGTFLVAAVLHVALVYGGGIQLLLKLNPLHFFKDIVDAQMVAFSTSSSAATLPVTLKVAQEKLGVSKGTASFALPLGTTINMDGTALYQGICVMFVAQAVGVTLSPADLATVVFTATLASIGTAAIPGAGIIMLMIILQSVNLPVEAIALILGIDRILDMIRTMINVTGDAFVSMLVDESEGTFDEGKYHL